MGIREATGHLAHILLGGYWTCLLLGTAPQLRKSTRDRPRRIRILLIKSSAVALTAVVVGVIHFWATHWWQIPPTLFAAAMIGVPMRRAFRSMVAAPRHRRPLGQRMRPQNGGGRPDSPQTSGEDGDGPVDRGQEHHRNRVGRHTRAG